jgi:hypothetical protein
LKTAPPSTKPDLLLHYEQQVIIFKSLKRFEKLKIDYSKQYKIGLARRDSLVVLRQVASAKDSIIARYQTGIWKEGKDKQLAIKKAQAWEKKAKTRNVFVYTLLTIAAGLTYERIH